MAASRPARYLAPMALVAVFIAVVIVLASSGGASQEPPTTTAAAPRKPPPVRQSYRVREGDSLLAIANRTGVPIARLTALNPDHDPQALRPGQRVKLRP